MHGVPKGFISWGSIYHTPTSWSNLSNPLNRCRTTSWDVLHYSSLLLRLLLPHPFLQTDHLNQLKWLVYSALLKRERDSVCACVCECWWKVHVYHSVYAIAVAFMKSRCGLDHMIGCIRKLWTNGVEWTNVACTWQACKWLAFITTYVHMHMFSYCPQFVISRTIKLLCVCVIQLDNIINTITLPSECKDQF